jgi:hypothetical protein
MDSFLTVYLDYSAMNKRCKVNKYSIMNITELRQPKISKSVERSATDYFKKGNLDYVSDDHEDFDEPEYELLRKLKKLGWNQFGNGAFSLVFSNPKKNYVLKLTLVSDPGYDAYVQLILSHPNKYFPHISDLKTIDVDGKKFGIYLIEKLTEMTNPWNDIYSLILRTMMGGDQRMKGILTLQNTPAPRSLQYTQAQWEQVLDKIAENDEFMTAIQLVSTWYNKRMLRIDMHQGNIMQRKDGTVVITDPYAAATAFGARDALDNEDNEDNWAAEPSNFSHHGWT